MRLSPSAPGDAYPTLISPFNYLDWGVLPTLLKRKGCSNILWPYRQGHGFSCVFAPDSIITETFPRSDTQDDGLPPLDTSSGRPSVGRLLAGTTGAALAERIRTVGSRRFLVPCASTPVRPAGVTLFASKGLAVERSFPTASVYLSVTLVLMWTLATPFIRASFETISRVIHILRSAVFAPPTGYTFTNMYLIPGLFR